MLWGSQVAPWTGDTRVPANSPAEVPASLPQTRESPISDDSLQLSFQQASCAHVEQRQVVPPETSSSCRLVKNKKETVAVGFSRKSEACEGAKQK